VSGFVALSLVPMMCSKFLKHEHSWLYRKTDPFFMGIVSVYRAMLTWTLRHRWVIGIVFFATLGSMVWLYIQLKQELSPDEDRSLFLAFVITPEGSSMSYTDSYVHAVEEIAKGVPEIDTMFAVVAPGLDRPNPVNLGVAFAVLKPWAERTRSQQQITKELGPKLFGGLPGALSFTKALPPLGQPLFSKRVEYVLYGTTYEELQGRVGKVMAKLRDYPGITALDTDLKLNKPQLAVKIDREKAAALGISMETIGHTLETLLGGFDVTRYKHEGKQYDVVVQMEDDKRRQPSDLTSIYVRGDDGALNQLSNLVSIQESVGPKELNHFNKLRAAVINGEPAGNFTLGQVLDHIDEVVKAELGPETRTDLDNISREFRESSGQLAMTFLLALVIIYLVLSAQFESFVGPLVIMFTVPLAMTGALLVMFINAKLEHGGTLNVYSQVGLVMLVGLITKHGILIVEFANQLRERGADRMEAITEAATMRLRPILMTTAAMVLGALPLALAHGAGAESRQAIGWVVVGGLMLGTLLTLFVIPTIYSIMVRNVHKARDENEDSDVVPELQEQFP
jgi:multidrug efflux pump